MELIVAIALSIAFSFALRNAIKAHPGIFYALAALVAIAFAGISLGGAIPGAVRFAYPYVQRCLFAFGLLAVVMYLGVLPEDSRARKYLAPIRGELSIIASILVAGHVANYVSSYATRFLESLAGMAPNMAVSFAVSAVLVVLLAILAATSITAVRKRMSAGSWKKVQLLAYPFFILIYVHLAFVLAPSASGLGQKATFSVIVYTVIIGGYVVLRIYRAIRSRRDAVRYNAS